MINHPEKPCLFGKGLVVNVCHVHQQSIHTIHDYNTDAYDIMDIMMVELHSSKVVK